MLTFFAALVVVVIFAIVVYRFVPKRDERAAELLERYRSHAPMADWSMSYYEEQRQLSELAAIRARRDAEICRAPAAARRFRGFGRCAVQF
ncbi:hypothetical protein [Nocardia sp. NPDC051570]|uniref:hypothetical protein n=1 Tax=Nocardia sp. NPDC051570 TaxID=3364324 RepID=UPI0037B460BC